jgi:hypothetical protein
LPTPGVGDNFAGHGWIVTEGDGDLWFWNSTNAAWDNIGQIVGPQGDQGPSGADGAQGEQGDPGPAGADGADALWNWQGEYNAEPQYQEGDIVAHQGSTYRRNGTGNSVVGFPPPDATYWELVSAKGAQGEPGTGTGGDTDRLVNGDFSVYLQSNGSLVIPSGDRQENESRYQGAILSENESSHIFMDVQTDSPGNVYGGMRLETWNSVPIDIRTRAGGQGDAIKNWRFDSDGALTLPLGGTISYTPDDSDNWNEPAVNTVQAALDELAARVTALQNYEIDGGNAYTPPQGEFIIDGNGA